MLRCDILLLAQSILYLLRNFQLNKYLTSEVNTHFTHSPVCLPPRKSFSDRFVTQKVKVSGYGRTVSDKVENIDSTACELQIAGSVIVNTTHASCKKVRMIVQY